MQKEIAENTNIPTMLDELKKQALDKLQILKKHVDHLEKAINDQEIETRGVGVGWVHNLEEPLQAIKHYVTEIDALARVRIYSNGSGQIEKDPNPVNLSLIDRHMTP